MSYRHLDEADWPSLSIPKPMTPIIKSRPACHMVKIPFEVMETIIEEILLANVKGGRFILAGRLNYRVDGSLVNWSIRDEILLGNRFKRTYKLRWNTKDVLKKVAAINTQFQQGVKNYSSHPLTITTLNDIPHLRATELYQQVEVLLLYRFQDQAWARLGRFLDNSKSTLRNLVLDIAPSPNSNSPVIIPASLWVSIFKAKEIRCFTIRAYQNSEPAIANSNLLKRMMSEWKNLEELELHHFQGTSNDRMGGMIYYDSKVTCSLTSLFLKHPNQIHQRDLEFMMSKSYKTLQELTIFSLESQASQLEIILNVFNKCKSIKTFRVAIYQPRLRIMVDGSDDEFAETIKLSSSPKRISRSQVCISDTVQHLPKLKHLELAGDVWSDEIIKNLASVVQLSSLTLRNVRNCDFGFLNQSIQSDPKMRDLKKLNVFDCSDLHKTIPNYHELIITCQQKKIKFGHWVPSIISDDYSDDLDEEN
ncbi:hypothetical protein DFH28DRAFT_942407 [Melampsora americana]|nr:hypothetical protein DFH28DRAFT_942407 [Melampsora americana]